MSIEIKASQYQPSTPDERIEGFSLLLDMQDRSGFVFLLITTKKQTADAEMLMQIMSEQVHRLAQSFGRESNPQHRFEQFLGALNETLANQVRDGRWNVSITDVNAIVGIASGRQMFLSGTGDLTALFLHKKPSQRYQVYNLFRGIQTEQSLPTWEKPFAIVLDGDLHPGDIFCICDKDLQRAIAPDELNSILSTLPPVGATEKVRQYFSHKEGLLLIIIKANGHDNTTNNKEVALKSNVSVEHLTRTEESTDRLLDDQRPNPIVILKRLLIPIFKRAQGRSRILQDIAPATSTGDKTKQVARWFGKILWFLLKRSLRHTRETIINLSKPEGRKQLKKKVAINKRAAGTFFQRITGGAQSVPRSTKFLIIGIASAVLVFAIGISTLSKSQARSAEEAAYQETLVTIDDMMERGAGAVIYKDEDQARSLYLNALTLIEKLELTTPERQEKSEELIVDVQTALDEIRNLVTIPNPPLLADLSTITDGVFGNALVESDGKIYVFGSDGGVYELDRSNRKFSTTVEGITGVSADVATEEDGRIYFLSESGSVFFVDTGDKKIEQSLEDADVFVDALAYANRLYLLRPSSTNVEGQLIRYERNGSEFSSPSDWIESRTVAFDDAVSVSIDGTVFILMKDGEIARFSSGSEVGWTPGVVDPPFTNTTDIWTDSDSNYVYVLEPDAKRLVVFEKESGNFLVQYRSDAFQGLTDFLVDENDYTIYLLAGSKLYSIAASHVK